MKHPPPALEHYCRLVADAPLSVTALPDQAAIMRELVEDALRMNASALARHEVQAVREFTVVPDITVDKHKVLQILVNLIRNAKFADGHEEPHPIVKTSDPDRISNLVNWILSLK